MKPEKLSLICLSQEDQQKLGMCDVDTKIALVDELPHMNILSTDVYSGMKLTFAYQLVKKQDDEAVSLFTKLNPQDQSEVLALSLMYFFDILYYTHRSTFIRYDGVWKELLTDKSGMCQEVHEEIASIYALVTKRVPTKSQIQSIRDVIQFSSASFIKAHNYYEPEPRSEEIYLRDHIYNVDTNEKTEYTKNQLIFTKFAYDFDNANTNTKSIKLDNFLNEVLKPIYVTHGKDQRDETKYLLKQYMAYALLKNFCLTKALILYGHGNDGKSMFAKIVTTLIGEDKTSITKLSDLNSDITIENCKDKYISYDDDMDGDVQFDTGNIKKAIDGAFVQVNPKYRNPYSYRYTSKLLIATNRKPYSLNTATNVQRRLIIVPFQRKFLAHEEDPNIHEYVLQDSEIIFQELVEIASKLYKTRKFAIPACINQELEQYIEDNNQVLQSLTHENSPFELDPTNNRTDKSPYWISKTIFYDLFRHHKIAVENYTPHKVPTKKRAMELLSQQGFAGADRRLRVDGESVIYGIRVKPHLLRHVNATYNDKNSVIIDEMKRIAATTQEQREEVYHYHTNT